MTQQVRIARDKQIAVVAPEQISAAVAREQPFVVRGHPLVRSLAKEFAPKALAAKLAGTTIQVEHKLRWLDLKRVVDASTYLARISASEYYWRQFPIASVGLRPILPRPATGRVTYFDYGWIGPAGTVQTFHQDNHNDTIVNNNLYAQVIGRKYVAIASPDDSDFFRNMPLTDKEKRHSRALPWDVITRDQCKTLRESFLDAGDILYIPPKYWHFMQSKSMSVSISRWWFTNPIAELLYASEIGIEIRNRKDSSVEADWESDVSDFGGIQLINQVIMQKPLLERVRFVIKLSRIYGKGILDGRQE